jgi:hypothetical protein
MKQIKTVMWAAVAIVLTGLMAGCRDHQPVDFSMTLSEDLGLYGEHVVQGRRQMVQLSAGRHFGTAHISDDHLDVIMSGDLNNRMKFNLPKGKEFPANGSFDLRPMDSTQPVILKLNVETVVQKSATRKYMERCDLPGRYSRCDYDPVWGRICDDYATWNGQREVVAHDESTSTFIKGDVISLKNKPIGFLEALTSKTTTIYDSVGPCR